MIYSMITDDYHFWSWLKSSDNYKNNFSLEGAKAVQAYFDELSEDISSLDNPTVPQGIEFDPIAWCCEFSEYDSLEEFNNQYWGTDNDANHFTLETLEDNTTVLELENGHIVVGEF